MRVHLGLLLLIALTAPCLSAQTLPVGAEGKKVLTVKLAVSAEGKVFDRDPDSAKRTDVLNKLRTRETRDFRAAELAKDIDYLTTESHLFRAVTWQVELDEKLDGVRVKLILTQPLIWRIRYVAPRDGRWVEDAVRDAWTFSNLMDSALASEFSLVRLDADIKRLYYTRKFLDIRSEHTYGEKGVDLLLRVIQNEPLCGVSMAGVHEAGFRQDLIKVLGGRMRAREIPGGDKKNEDDPTNLVGKVYFDQRAFDFDLTTDADAASILAGASLIQVYYEYRGFPFVHVTPRLVGMPRVWDRGQMIKSYPDLSAHALDLLAGRFNARTAGRLVLVYQVYEGPKVLVGDITFSGIENLGEPDDSDAMKPAHFTEFPAGVLDIWYSMPWANKNAKFSEALMRKNQTKLFPGQPFVYAYAEHEASLMQEYLRSRGWRDARLTVQNINWNHGRTRASVIYHVEPGPLYAATTVRIELATKSPRVPAGTQTPEFDKPCVTFEDIFKRMSEYTLHGKEIPLEQAREQFTAAYVDALNSPQTGKYFSAWTFDKPFTVDDLRLEGDGGRNVGAIGRIKEIFAAFGYSNINIEIEPIYAYEGELKTEYKLPTPVKPVGLILRIDQGYKSRVGTITIRGNEETRDDVVRRLISLYSGDEFNRNELERSLARMRFTNWFEAQAPGGGVRQRSTPRLVQQGDTILEYTDFNFDVIEGRTGNFNISAGFNTSTGFIATLDLAKKNFDIASIFRGDFSFTGAGQEIALSLQPPIDRAQRYSLTFREPWTWGRPVETGVVGEYNTRDFGLYSISRLGVDPYGAWRVVPDVELSLGYGYSIVDLFDVGANAPIEIREDQGQQTLSAVTFGAAWSTRDDPRFPTRGWLLSGKYRYTGGIFGGTLDFWRLSFDGRYYIPIAQLDDIRTLALAFQLQAQWQDIHSNTDRIPFSQRFLLGGNSPSGQGILRGFEFGGVGPSRDNEAIGGNFITTFTTELRLPVFPGALYAVAFIDAGQLTGSINTWDARGITVSGGVGLRLVLPVLPVPFALDFGFPIINQPGNREQVLSINLGFGF
ncbi:MAG: BamA/TamA family outer membrane protein [Planctomycetes bacterium]|nr:BamA/TamA family outer membrane protein [Planctomycetota bacterium]